MTKSHPRQPDQGWFYHRAGTDYGPMGREDLAETLRLLPLEDVSVWHPNLPGWIHSSDAGFRSMVFGSQAEVVDRDGLLTQLFSFQGRIGRARYFWLYCLSIVPYIAATFATLAYTHAPLFSDTGNLIRLALSPPFVWIGLALTAKRLHDLDMSTAHLVWIAPSLTASSIAPPGPAGLALTILSAVVELGLVLKRGTRGANRYGSDPLSAGMSDLVAATKEQKSSWGPITGLIVVVLGAFIIYELSGLKLSGLGSLNQLTCSRGDVLETAKSAIVNDPRETLGFIMQGGSNNLRLSLTDVRTQSYDQPVNGLTCVATLVSTPINKDNAVYQSGGSADVTYTVQNTDANDGHYVVNILSD